MRLRPRPGGAPEGRPLILPLRGAAPPPFAEAAAAAGFDAAKGEALRLFLPREAVLVGCGDGSPAALLRAGAAGLRALWPQDRAAPERVAMDVRGFAPADAALLAEGALIATWTPPVPRAEPWPSPPRRLDLLCGEEEALRPALEAAKAVAEGVRFARDLVALPGNLLPPRAFADRLAALEEADLAVEVIGPKRLARMGAGGLCAVGGAATNGPYLVTLRWRGSIPADPVVFVGKGITFDTGGVCVKPAKGMEEMRADMAGAAAAAGAMLALARRRSSAPAAAVLAIAENALGAASCRPGDVLRMLDGRSVEVVDTDAEGRLVLADALAHARRVLRPAAMVTLATLTGSVVVALGHHRAGLFGSDPPLMAALAAAGEATGERLWPLPIGERHRRDLESDIADLRHCVPAGKGEGWGGRFLPDACHAAAFLREFAGDVPWGHLDIAGVESLAQAGPFGPKGMPSGFGVRLLDRLVARHFEDPHRL
ncbi:MAG: leucyl aminopeptidase family protein [Acetobacteraceae bacterium]|nr:leucyl aminopeptidase family protein [Acetobacteraceae bacterium]